MIIAVENDGTLKIRNTQGLSSIKWNDCQSFNNTCSDNNQINSWSKATLRKYLNKNYYQSLSSSIKNKIIEHTSSAGAVDPNNNNLNLQINQERKNISYDNITFITVSDYIKAQINESECGTIALLKNNYIKCRDENYLFLGQGNWTITPVNNDFNNVMYIRDIGYPYIALANISGGSNAFPVMYLKANLQLEGSGTSSDPYKILEA